MKKLIYLFTALLLSSTAVNAESSDVSTTNYRNYGKSFIFEVDGIEFSVFPDGQFDFNIRRYASNVNFSANVGNVSINYNSGFDYSGYLQYDEFGAIIQIENTFVDYDYYGRVNQIGDIRIRYDHANRISRIGGLNIYFNNFGRFDYCNGYINNFNRFYVYRPWHRFYILPPVNYCVIFNQPYRRYYTPIRYRFDRPYRNNFRRTTAVASRRGNTVTRNRRYASSTEGRTRITSTPRTRGNVTTSTPRTRGNNVTTPRTRTRSNTTTSLPRTRGNTSASSPRPSRNTIASKPRVIKNRNVSTPTRTQTKRTVKPSVPKTNKRVVTKTRTMQSRASRPASSSKRTSTRNKSNRR